MAQPFLCDFLSDETGKPCGLPAVALLTVIESGDVQAICPEHVPHLAAGLVHPYGLTLAPAAETEPNPDEESDEDTDRAQARSRPRKRRHVAVVPQREGPAVETQESDTQTAG